MKTKITLLVLTLCIGIIIFTGCSSASARGSSFQMAFSALYMNSTAIGEYGTALTNKMPELTIDGNAPHFIPVFAGVVENNFETGVLHDPMMGLAGMMQMSMLVMSGDLDLVVATLDNAARDARNDMFIPLDEIFTAEEMAAFGDRLLSFEHVDTDGFDTWPTGEMTPICGINITGNEDMRKIFGNQEIGVFIVANTGNLDLAKGVMLSLVGE